MTNSTIVTPESSTRWSSTWRVAPLGAEVPLLAHDVPEGPSAVGRPAHDVLLGALHVGFDELEPDPAESLRRREDQPDRLLAGLGRPPARALTGDQRRLDGMCRILRGDLHLRQALEIQPGIARRLILLLRWRNDSFTHFRFS